MEQDANQQPLPEPKESRRDVVPELDGRDVTFARRALTAERLEALKKFLTTASADDIMTIRETYGDLPEVLRSIGLEIDMEK